MADTKNEVSIAEAAARAAAKAIAEEMLPTFMAAQQLANRQAADERPQLHAPAPIRETCHVCGQALKTGCMGEHEMAVVFPKRYPEHGDFFQGVILNGVKYLSNDDQHKIPVPKNAVATIEGFVQAFENNEQETRVGRKAERYSGRVTPNGAQFVPQAKGWR